MCKPVWMEEDVRVRVDEARHHNLTPQVDVAVADFIIAFPLVDFGDAAALTVDSDGHILNKRLLLWVK